MKIFIYENIEDFKKFVGGGANVSLYQETIEPIMRQALYEHLIPWLGEDFFDVWSDSYPYTAAAAADELQPFLQRALAFLTLYEYSKIANVQLGENGMFRTESENYKSVYKYQENSYKDFMLNNGYEALEEAVKFLEKNEADFATWTASDEHGNRIRTSFINHASEFRAAYAKHISRYTFESMRTMVEDLEVFSILPVLGQDFYDELKLAVKDQTLTATQKPLIKLIRKALANFTISEALQRNMVIIKGNKIIQSEKLGDQSLEKESIPSLKLADVKLRHTNEWGNRFISYITKYLSDNLDSFPTYQTYIEALAEAEEEAATCEDARPNECGCENKCGCYESTTRTGVFRL